VKRNILILAAFTGLTAVSSCSKDKAIPETPTLSVSFENVHVTAAAADCTVAIPYYPVVYIEDNQLSATVFSTIFTALPIIASNSIILYTGDNSGTSACDTGIAINKNWRINDGY
jgi:hypothetical protein